MYSYEPHPLHHRTDPLDGMFRTRWYMNWWQSFVRASHDGDLPTVVKSWAWWFGFASWRSHWIGEGLHLSLWYGRSASMSWETVRALPLIGQPRWRNFEAFAHSQLSWPDYFPLRRQRNVVSWPIPTWSWTRYRLWLPSCPLLLWLHTRDPLWTSSCGIRVNHLWTND